MDPYAWWIFGYAKFYEPIVRRCIARKRGWDDITEEVSAPPIADVLGSLDAREDWEGDLRPLKDAARSSLEQRVQRIRLDAAFSDAGSAVLGEFKSWGACHRYGLEEAHRKIAAGRLFPERLAIPYVNQGNQHKNVAGFVFAAVLSDPDSAGATFPLGELTVYVENIPRLLGQHGQAVAEELEAFRQLDMSVNLVKQFLRTGAMD